MNAFNVKTLADKQLIKYKHNYNHNYN